MTYPVYRVSTTEGATISGDLVNNMKDRLFSYLSEQQVKLLHNVSICFSSQMNKNKSKNNSLCQCQFAREKIKLHC